MKFHYAVVSAFMLFFFLHFTPYSTAQPSRINTLNLSWFSSQAQAAMPSSDALIRSLSEHPDFGKLPVRSTPCSDCYEVLGERGFDHRRFVKESTSGNTYYEQFASGAINYKDEDGYWREIDSRLRPSSNGLYIADRQPYKVELNLQSHNASLVIGDMKYVFNQDISLWYLPERGEPVPLGKGDWSQVSAGDQGVVVRNFYPGVDLVFQVREGTIESGFLLHEKLPFTSGALVMKMGVTLPEGSKVSAGGELGFSSGAHTAFFFSNKGIPVCQLKPCFAFDDSETNSVEALNTHYEDNQFSIAVPVSWLNAPARNYPVLIDPVITTQGVLNNGSGGVDGTRYSAVCWTNGCDYSLSVPTPANAQLTGVYSSFEYYAATGICQGRDGGYSISLNGCTAPAASPGVFTCSSTATNYYCGSTNTAITPDISTCLPQALCASQNLDFTLHFYRCNNSPDTGCSSSCISASQPWIITLESRDLELPFVSPTQQVCSGQQADVVVVAQYGIGPYSYSWSPVSGNRDTLSVSPLATTSYTVQVTDQCGVTRTASSTVSVQTTVNPGFALSSAVVCTDSPVTLNGNGNFAASSYDWVVPGSNAAAGVLNNIKTPVIRYSLPGVYPVTLRFQSGGCTVDSTLLVTVQAPSPAQVILSSSPSGILCPGSTVVFSATTTNGGTSPAFAFYQNGNLLQSGTANSFQITNLQNGDVIQVVMTSSATSCVSPLVDTAALFMAVSGLALPEVSITASPSLCQGVPVSLTAVPQNGGNSPSYQWLVNGTVVSGVSGSTYSFTPGSNDASVAVIMTSSLACISALTADAQLAIAPAYPASVTLQSSTGGGICNGQPFTATALPYNGGDTPSFQWYVNGIATGDTTASFNSGNLVSGDVLTVQLTSSSACAIPATAVSSPLQIQVFPPLSALVFGASPVCEGLPVTVAVAAAGGDGGPYTYIWNDSSSTLPSYSFLPLNNQYVTIAIEDGCGSVPVRDSAYIIVKPLPQAGFSFLPEAPATGYPGVSFTDQSQNAVKVLWLFGDGDSTTIRNPVHDYALPGTYTVTQLSVASNGCVDTVRYEVVVTDDDVVFFANSFTPNNDLVNDLWMPVVPGGATYDYFIYDRWGHIIFEGDAKHPWDGTFKGSGKQVPPGVYTYLFKFNPEKKDIQDKNGKITLIR